MATVYVDLDGTLVRFDRPYEAVFRDAVASVGATVPEGAFDTYSEAFLDAFESVTPAPIRSACRVLGDEYDIDAGAEELRDAIVETEVAATTLTAGARDALSTLSGTHELGVLSNGIGELQRAKLGKFDLQRRFEAVLISGDLGVRKPEPEVFTIARTRLPADRYVYVCDDPAHDVRPANEAGFVTVQIDGDPDSPADARLPASAFDRLPELI